MGSRYPQESIDLFVRHVDDKFNGAVAPNDAATIAAGVSMAFESSPNSAVVDFTEKAMSYGMERGQADYMVRTAVKDVCPHHLQDLFYGFPHNWKRLTRPAWRPATFENVALPTLRHGHVKQPINVRGPWGTVDSSVLQLQSCSESTL
jgi:hypothetical protein